MSLHHQEPPLWRDFKSYFKHKCKVVNFEELIVLFRIEEDDRKTKRKFVVQHGANFVKSGLTINKNCKVSGDAPERDNFKKCQEVQMGLLQI